MQIDLNMLILMISVVISFIALIITLVTTNRKNKREDASDGKNYGILVSDMGYFKKSQENLEIKMDKILEGQNKDNVRITTLEVSFKEHCENSSLHSNYKRKNKEK